MTNEELLCSLACYNSAAMLVILHPGIFIHKFLVLHKKIMAYPQEHIKPYGADGKKSEQVEEMFDNIAPAYDKLNHTLSMGIDRSWRRKAIKCAPPF